jgi:hypothetical protein
MKNPHSIDEIIFFFEISYLFLADAFATKMIGNQWFFAFDFSGAFA